MKEKGRRTGSPARSRIERFFKIRETKQKSRMLKCRNRNRKTMRESAREQEATESVRKSGPEVWKKATEASSTVGLRKKKSKPRKSNQGSGTQGNGRRSSQRKAAEGKKPRQAIKENKGKSAVIQS